MIGGTVIEIIELPQADRIWINCKEVLPEDSTSTPSECAIFVERDIKARGISEGDFLWWQDMLALWTPKEMMNGHGVKKDAGLKCGMHFDIQLKKIGYSGQARPS